MLEKSVYGVVDRVDKVDGELVPHCIRKWIGTIGNMEPTEEEPTIFLIEKLEPMILKHKKYKCMFGGRAGTKSRFSYFLINKIRKAKLIGINKATRFPNNEPVVNEPLTITKIPTIAKIIDRSVFKLIFSFKKR